ncbi:MAG: D-2-hydroxyacid dehydrogenase [Acidobacteria bacterium]|nr:D-2-hydroxyacid dehydrogenase [Acidobacteriota bacterium]
MKLVVLDGYALNPGDLSWDSFGQLAHLTVHERTDTPLIVERAAAADLILTNKTPLSSETLASLPRLKYIGVLATGYNVVDVKAAAARRVTVTNVPSYGSSSVAQLTFALILELCNNVGIHDSVVKTGEWSRNPDWCFWLRPQVELYGKVMGIVGFGRIGRAVAKIAEAFGMRLLVANHRNPDLSGFSNGLVAPLEDVLRQADVVSLHCPLTPQTQNIISREHLALMKPTAFLINTSRGALIMEDDLAESLNSGRLAGAAVDVLSSEPPRPDNPLLRAKNCIVTPHMAWATREARARLMETAVNNLASFLAGQPINVVGLE